MHFRDGFDRVRREPFRHDFRAPAESETCRRARARVPPFNVGRHHRAN